MYATPRPAAPARGQGADALLASASKLPSPADYRDAYASRHMVTQMPICRHIHDALEALMMRTQYWSRKHFISVATTQNCWQEDMMAASSPAAGFISA